MVAAGRSPPWWPKIPSPKRMVQSVLGGRPADSGLVPLGSPSQQASLQEAYNCTRTSQDHQKSLSDEASTTESDWPTTPFLAAAAYLSNQARLSAFSASESEDSDDEEGCRNSSSPSSSASFSPRSCCSDESGAAYISPIEEADAKRAAFAAGGSSSTLSAPSKLQGPLTKPAHAQTAQRPGRETSVAAAAAAPAAAWNPSVLRTQPLHLASKCLCNSRSSSVSFLLASPEESSNTPKGCELPDAQT
eukprot:CAMPEP_0206455290 /NCGR_PEP_ID=MMETSP0324_2-20121206/21663_1 /ASSEMBLY_ACC=CAM_ASM_000836 /TAXON_ID=2866 /ORGANISM="Crypthecodinium cohnii, Strain Seligo" /LENGTH=246 /DNA_ID=CAMNT_0053925963 /DNA_START=101 /DNA_END=842 /DNA_ORIENTATION=+